MNLQMPAFFTDIGQLARRMRTHRSFVNGWTGFRRCRDRALFLQDIERGEDIAAATDGTDSYIAAQMRLDGAADA